MNNQNLNDQVAKAAGVPVTFGKRTDTFEEWNPREEYNQIIACIEAQGWDWTKRIVDGKYLVHVYSDITTKKLLALAYCEDLRIGLCKAFIEACEAVAKSATNEETSDE
jgi:hypothetical protein